METSIREIVELYSLLKEKDTFLYKYWEQLARRVSTDSSYSTELDTRLVGLMKQSCYTNNLRRISHFLQDLEISKMVNERFKAPFEVNLKVFSVSNWPAMNEWPIVYPEELQTVKASYEAFYKKHFPDRRLTWLLSETTVELFALYLPKKYILQVTLYQFVVLSTLGTGEVSYEELRTRCGMKRNVLDHQLRGLFSQVATHSLVLKQNFKTPLCDDKELLKLNEEFTSVQLRRSFIPTKLMAKSESKKVDVEDNEARSIAKERMYVTESLIMKIMKVCSARKR
eukprot:TRINITY_DN12283_c0_g2_i1.p1 TRINITY_DN12283_c0_g2~~TRINITY_DN12283_c0_g2_i1.p1  ORF type:complete len:321 (+),score=95.20 TRINITY_DN12283_c0_g2_i1:117-965(+)